MTKVTAWGRTDFHVQNLDGPEKQVMVGGRKRWALGCLVATGKSGYTLNERPGPRWPAYVFDLRNMGVGIETIREPHGGLSGGTPARYFLRSQVTRAEGGEQ
jgi:hypothetical protein